MAILDQFGKPIDVDNFDEPQTSRLVSLHQQVAGHPARNLTPARLNAILESAENGDLIAQHELFRDMEERDGHVFAELSKRKRAVIKLSWDVVPPRNPSKEEEQSTAYVKELLLDMPDLEDLFFDALDGVAHGFSAVELEWQRVGSDWTIIRAQHRPQTWFQLDREQHTTLNLRDGTLDGSPLRPFGWLLHIHKAASGYTSRSGLGRVLVWPYLFKHFSVGDLAEFLDIYGLPLRIGKYPSNASDTEKATLWRAVAGIGHNAAGVIPASMAIDFQEAAKGSEKPFETMIKWCEQTQSKAILGSTMTSTTEATGLGSGVAEIHNEVRLDIRDSDCKQLAGTLTRDLIFPLLALNKGWADFRRCPRLVFDVTEGEDIKTYADALPKLVGIGMRIPTQWAHETLRIPLPSSDEEEVLAVAKTATPTPPEPGQEPKLKAKKADTKAALLAALRDAATEFPDQDALDGALEDLAPALQPQVAAWLKPALDALEKASGPEAALALLASENPLTDDVVLVEAIARALFVTELLGAEGVRQELEP
jgi:phage gp29-like protein